MCPNILLELLNRQEATFWCDQANFNYKKFLEGEIFRKNNDFQKYISGILISVQVPHAEAMQYN